MALRFVLSLALLLAAAWDAPAADYTALDRYIERSDPSFKYSLVSSVRVQGVSVYVLDLTSQSWLTANEVNQPDWRHRLTIIRPESLTTNTALLLVNGGSNPPSFSPIPDLSLLLAAIESGAVVVDLAQVPNQPLRFAGEARDRSEDAIIAYTWSRFLETGDERWPARLPMTKSVVRAMDAVTSFLASEQGGKLNVNQFIVTGGSKRGWTTWSTAAVDPRVVAIAPLVIDLLNIPASFVHHFRAYGFWAPAIRDYEEAGLASWLGHPRFSDLMAIEDPYEYRDRMSLPKYLINSTGDQFFLPDSAQFYFHDLPGEKYLRYVPNTDHGLESPETLLNLLAWFQAVTSNTPRPRFYWRSNREHGWLYLRTIDKPSKVLLWQATNPNARDFRVETIGKAWTSKPVEGDAGQYSVSIPKPDRGWTAFFFELTYEGRGKYPLVFTTEIIVTPDEYPFPAPAASPARRPTARTAR
jgi:PhoPQ-activated pathogenicity-related protein